VTRRRDLAGHYGDTESPHSRTRFDASAASSYATKRVEQNFPDAFFLNRRTLATLPNA
jgi:hypothetical protein